MKKNGDFLPTFLVDGFVAGLWMVASSKGGAVIALSSFRPVKPKKAVEEEALRLLHYMEPEAASHRVEWR